MHLCQYEEKGPPFIVTLESKNAAMNTVDVLFFTDILQELLTSSI